MARSIKSAYFALRHRPRLTASTVVGAVLWSLLGLRMPASQALLWAFDVSALLYLGSSAWMMARATPRSLERRARLAQDGKWSVLVFSLAMTSAVVVALSMELRAASGQLGTMALAGSSIVLAWLFLAAQFALQYAHTDQLQRAEGTPALLFPGNTAPDYWDYLYFSVVLSMTFQTADVSIAGRHVRRLALLHGVVAFFFNVGILALTINALAGVLAK